MGKIKSLFITFVFAGSTFTTGQSSFVYSADAKKTENNISKHYSIKINDGIEKNIFDVPELSVRGFYSADYCYKGNVANSTTIDNEISNIKNSFVDEDDKECQRGFQSGIGVSALPDNVRKFVHDNTCIGLFKTLTQYAHTLYLDAMKAWNSKDVKNCVYKDDEALSIYRGINTKTRKGVVLIPSYTVGGPAGYLSYKFRDIDIGGDYYFGDFAFTYENTKEFLVSYYKLVLFEFGYQLKTNDKYKNKYEDKYDEICKRVPRFDATEDALFAAQNKFELDVTATERVNNYLKTAFQCAYDYADNELVTEQESIENGKFMVDMFSAVVNAELDVITAKLSAGQQTSDGSDNSDDESENGDSEYDENSEGNNLSNNNSMNHFTTHFSADTPDINILGKKHKRNK